MNKVLVTQNRGKKIIQSARKYSDIFNLSTDAESRTQIPPKEKIKELTEKHIDEKLREVSPFLNGRKNFLFVPRHLASSVNLGGDSIRSNYEAFISQNEQREINRKTLHRSFINPQKESKMKNHNYIKVQRCINVKKTKIPGDITNHKAETMFDINDMSKSYNDQLKKEKLQQHQNIIDKASLSLIAYRTTQNEDLLKVFEKSKSTFDENEIFVKDHLRERAKEKEKNAEKYFKSRNARSRNGLKMTRSEIIDYYTMNDQIIEKQFSSLTIQENESFFQDYKKINSIILKEQSLNIPEQVRVVRRRKTKENIHRNESTKKK